MFRTASGGAIAARGRSSAGNGFLGWYATALRHGDALAVAAAGAIVFVLVFVNWFDAGRFFATGDLGLFFRRGAVSEVGSLWTHENSGAGGAAYGVVRLPELALISLSRLLGGGEPLAERLLFSTMFAWAATGAAACCAASANGPSSSSPAVSWPRSTCSP